jgi:hypothetical protein
MTSAPSPAPAFVDCAIPNERDSGTVCVCNDPLANQALETTLEDSFALGHRVRTQMRNNQGPDFSIV